ncbi:unnamed protein product [Lymnaea stagnalis]|uniref:Ubiquitin-like domain-containing protein n=1 Tax=Lymnaea stagnalis TaxID=6523 RepID=A0AAV2H8C6_LYMST
MEKKFHVSNRKAPSKVRSARRRPGCIRLFVCPTTGGRLEISVSPLETVVGLKVALARKLGISPSKISLIYKDKVIKGGCIHDHQIPDESHVTLLPNMESGLSPCQSDKSIIQALENLTETEVNDFLSGRSPLMLAVRMGDNMVFVQLQLSMLQGQRGSSQPCPTLSPMTTSASAVLSQTGLSASAIAEATRCLSQRIHHLQEINRTSITSPSSPTSVPRSMSVPRSASLPQTVTDVSQSVPSQSVLKQPHRLPSLARVSDNPVVSPPPGQGDNPIPASPPSPSGAVIDNMKHLGRGVYTGTFQGILDPTLQDVYGQPRRSVNTILHILNDLLVAAPNSTPPNSTQVLNPRKHQSPNPCPNVLQTPSLSSTVKTSPGLNENPENIALRGKMQQIQMMLAHRKEQRRTRRETLAPYANVQSHQKLAPSVTVSTSLFAPSSSASSSVCLAAATTASSESSASSVGVPSEGSSDTSGSYCKPTIEQDSLAV